MPGYEHIRYGVEGGVATLLLHRPERRNAWTRRMGDEFRHALAAADADDAVRVIVVSGTGPDFCVGADLEGGGAAVFTPAAASAADRTAAATFRCWQIRKPIIGAINGAAAGVGATLPLQWDIRLAGESTRMAFVFVRRGLVPEAASSWLLQRLVGLSRAAEILLTGRMLGAAELLADRLVSRVVPDAELLPTAQALGREIAAATAPVAVALTKQLLWRAAGEPDPAAAEVLDALVFGWAKHSAEGREGIRAFLEKRAPAWPLTVGEDLPTLESFLWDEED